MMEVIVFNVLIALAICFFAIVGYRYGFIGQLASVFGMGFGVVAAALLPEELGQTVWSICPHTGDEVVNRFAAQVIPPALVYLLVYGVFLLLGPIIRKVLRVINNGLVNSLAGGLFAVLQTLMVSSILLNMLLCTGGQDALVREGRADDANLTEVTMLLAPALLSTPDVKDLALELQLQAAKAIS